MCTSPCILAPHQRTFRLIEDGSFGKFWNQQVWVLQDCSSFFKIVLLLWSAAWSWGITLWLCCWLWFPGILSKTLQPCSWGVLACSFFAVSLSGFGMPILASHPESWNVPSISSTSGFWKSLRIGIRVLEFFVVFFFASVLHDFPVQRLTQPVAVKVWNPNY